MSINLYDPRTMRKAVERSTKPKTFLRDTFFGRVETFDTKKVDVDFMKGNRKLAPFVHEKIGGKTVENTGYRTNTYTPVLIAPDTITTTDDILSRVAGESLYNGYTPEERAVQKMVKDFAKLEDMITRREEWMCSKAIFTGKIPIIGDSLNYEIDFEFENKEIKSGDDLWSNAKSNPINQLEEMVETVQKKGMTTPDVCIMATDAARAFINNANVQKVLDVKNIQLARIEPKQLPNGATYIGTIPHLGLDIYKYNEWFLDDFTNPEKPTTEPMVPEGYVGLLSTEADFFMAYGAVTIIDGKTERFVTVEGTRTPDTWIKKKPARRFFQLNSRPLPCPVEVDSWYVAKVL
ncbi:phage capsid protein [Clostridium botulinum]|uniref:major capsid protein n=1 Tax=Clostridium botulinum TaxID=1491 RepID=UPI000174E3A6|nr:major capsid protein [Clostridium botulinum]ACD52048.1 conserved hypothetical protein [Clostridium botulinum E3 str. Alaska E43]AJF29692.1 phage capsid protein [Clostridium botulinum]AJF32753.1 phage capsid protein [Clostridium botulinum]MBY6949083.1 major capsid protein [Clostridium botulinum]MBY7022797.1 major capsid protein [Clostridium botulinum]